MLGFSHYWHIDDASGSSPLRTFCYDFKARMTFLRKTRENLFLLYFIYLFISFLLGYFNIFLIVIFFKKNEEVFVFPFSVITIFKNTD